MILNLTSYSLGLVCSYILCYRYALHQAKPNAIIASRAGPAVAAIAPPIDVDVKLPADAVIVGVLVIVSFCATYMRAIPMIRAKERSVLIIGAYSLVLQ
jgi:hypothetical protein